MPDQFTKLAQEFNQTAANVGAGEGNWQMTVAKYLLLMRHKTETPEQKQQLTGTMLDAAIDRMEKIVKSLPQMSMYSPSTLESLYGVFRPLAAPENSAFMPQGASQRVVDATLEMVRVLEAYEKHNNVTSEHYTNIRKNYTDFSFFMLETAEVIQAAEAQRSSTTQSDITLGKPPNIKSRLGKPS
ncbi:MAG: hypothetical protein Q8K65_11130 [Alphaproteobacteria bacterium]|nr:hypothetical protein [Alphaproteobacteria bacterium]